MYYNEPYFPFHQLMLLLNEALVKSHHNLAAKCLLPQLRLLNPLDLKGVIIHWSTGCGGEESLNIYRELIAK